MASGGSSTKRNLIALRGTAPVAGVSLASTWKDVAIPAAEYTAMMTPGARDVFRPPVPALLGLDLLLRRDGSASGGDLATDNPSATYLMLDPAIGRAPAAFQGTCTVVRCAERRYAGSPECIRSPDGAHQDVSSDTKIAQPSEFVSRKYTSADHQLVLDYMNLIFGAAAEAQSAPPKAALSPQAFQRFVRARLNEMSGSGAGSGASAMVRDAVSVVAPRVQLQGLSETSLNGQEGILGRRCKASKTSSDSHDRFQVHLDSGRNVAARHEKLIFMVDGFESTSMLDEQTNTSEANATAAAKLDESTATPSPDPLYSTLVLVCGPTGSGKTAVVRHLVAELTHNEAAKTVLPATAAAAAANLSSSAPQPPLACVAVCDGPMSGLLDPQLTCLKNELKCAQCPAPKVLSGGGCLCCDESSGEQLRAALHSAAASASATTSREKVTSSGSSAEDNDSSTSSNAGTTSVLPVAIVELSGGDSVATLPASFKSLAARVVLICALDVNRAVDLWSARARPRGGNEPTSVVVAQALEHADCVVLTGEGNSKGDSSSGSGSSSGSYGNSQQEISTVALCRDLCKALNPSVHIVRLDPASSSSDTKLGTAGLLHATGAAPQALLDEKASAVGAENQEGSSSDARGDDKRNKEDVKSNDGNEVDDDDDSDEPLIGRLHFVATRPFHPGRFLVGIVQRLPTVDGASALSRMIDPWTHATIVAESAKQAQADLDAAATAAAGEVNEASSTSSGVDDPNSTVAARAAAEARHVAGAHAPSPTASAKAAASAAAQAAAAAGDEHNPWAAVLRLTGDQLWLASAPSMAFQLSHAGCVTKLTDAGIYDRRSSASSRRDDGEGVLSESRREQHLTVVFCGSARGVAAERGRLEYILNACLLADGELEQHEASFCTFTGKS